MIFLIRSDHVVIAVEENEAIHQARESDAQEMASLKDQIADLRNQLKDNRIDLDAAKKEKEEVCIV